MSSRSVARCGLCCALLACSAWISIPFGPVPFTLQTLVIMLLPQIMPAREALMTVAAYVLLGCAGLPVFSSFQGGAGVLLGPTGGFIWGFVVSMVPGAALMRARRLPAALRNRGGRGGAPGNLLRAGHPAAHGGFGNGSARCARGGGAALHRARPRQDGGEHGAGVGHQPRVGDGVGACWTARAPTPFAGLRAPLRHIS